MKVGIDIIEISRVSLDEKFIDRIALENEKKYIESFNNDAAKLERVASLWCVKEAVMKCLCLGKDSGVKMHDIELCHRENGSPFVILYGTAKARYEKLKLKELEISISHSKTVTAAICVAC